ncbi:MAG: sensor histidine kinase [Rhizobiaceae bacterium]|nr:sensor histidine kinase [Rhizobiaceae bacterium]
MAGRGGVGIAAAEFIRLAWMVLALACAAASGTGPAAAADAGPLVLTGPADGETVNPHLRYRLDPGWTLSVADFVGPAAVEMMPLPGPRPDFGYTNAKVWLRLDVVNATDGLDEWRLFMPVSFLQRLAIYRIGSDGAVATLFDIDEESPFSARPVDYPHIVAPFLLAPGERATLLVSYYSLGAARHPVLIDTPESFASRAGVSTAKNYAFYGMMLVMTALAAVALVILRQAVFAAYAAYTSCIFLYIAHADGMAFQYLWPDFPAFNSMAATVTGSGLMVFGGVFAMSFLQTRRHHPIMHRVLLGVVLSVLALDVVLWSIDPKLLNRLLVYMILVSVLSFLAAGLVAARTRFREVRFYLFAWLASLIPASLFTARFAFGIEAAFITPYDAIRLGLIFDALMMGLAIFDRYNHLRQTAMEETLAHAQRNLALGQRLALLEESYAEVSTQARQREESVKDTVHDLRQPMHALRLSLRQIFAGGNKTTDVGQIESALGYMERLVADRLADRPGGATSAAGARSAPGGGAMVPPDSAPPPASEAATGTEPGLHGVLKGVVDMFAPEAAEKGLDLRLVLAAPDAPAAAYPLMRVAANLVSNAIKYTRQGRVVVGLRRGASGYFVEVHDTGPGLAGDAFERALLRNQRLERDVDAAEGSGLGLAVVKEVADANGWRLSACAGRRTGASLRLDLS